MVRLFELFAALLARNLFEDDDAEDAATSPAATTTPAAVAGSDGHASDAGDQVGELDEGRRLLHVSGRS